MNNPSSAQLMYLRQCRRHQLKIKIFRVLILVVFYYNGSFVPDMEKSTPLFSAVPPDLSSASTR